MAVFGADLTGVGTKILTTLLYSLVAIFGAVFLAGIVYYLNHRGKYKDFVIIRSKDQNDNLQVTFDRGGVLKSRKTQNTFYQLLKDKQALINVASIKYTYSRKGRKVVELFNTGNGNYVSLSPTIDNENIKYDVSKSEVDWAVDQFSAFQKAFTGRSKLWELLPYLGLVLMFIALIIIGIYLIKAYPELVKGISSAANSMKETAKIQAGIIG